MLWSLQLLVLTWIEGNSKCLSGDSTADFDGYPVAAHVDFRDIDTGKYSWNKEYMHLNNVSSKYGWGASNGVPPGKNDNSVILLVYLKPKRVNLVVTFNHEFFEYNTNLYIE